jgi:beta-galactosidase/beta-glucuronidase
MSNVPGSPPTRREFLEELGVSAAAIVATGGACGLQPGAPGRSGKAPGGNGSPEAPPAETPSVRQEIDLSGPWRFQVDWLDEGEKVGYFSRDFPTNEWREISIPRAFDDCAPGMYKYRGVCWFCRHFEAPLSMRGRRVVVHFEGINYNTSVWVNGKHVGYNEDAFLPFEFPVEELLRFGENNLIVVRVDNLRRPAQLPTAEYWQGQGGILREVKLVATERRTMRG